MADFAKIQVQLEAESAKLRKELDRANAKLTGFERGAKKSLDGFSRAAKAAFGVFTVGAIVAATRNALEFADSIDKAAQRAGVSASALQELRFAGEQVGVTTQQLDDGMRRFTRRLGEFANSGGGPAAKALQELNIAINDTEGNLRPTEDVFNDVVQRLQGFESQAQRAAFAAQLFGDDAGPQLELLLRQGVDGIERLRKSASVMSDEQVADAVAAKDAMNQLSQQFTVAANSLVLQLAPALEGLADFLSTSLPNASNLGARSIAAIRQAALEVGAAVSGMSADLSETLSKVTFGEVSKRHEQFAREYRTREVELRQAISREIQVQIDALDDLERKNQRFTLPDAGGGFTPLPSPDGDTRAPTSSGKAGDALREANQEAEKLQTILDRLFPDQAKAREFNDELQRLQKANLPAEQLAEAVRRLQQEFADATGGPRKLADESEEAFEELSVFAEQAARNAQDALSEFLYDPFDDGVEGMVSGFSDAMRKMAAEAAAAQIFDAAGEFFGSGSGSAIGSFFSDIIPGFANGTNYAPGGLALVGERGPELVNLPRGSQVFPNDQSSRMVGSTTNISVTVTGEQADRNRQSGGQLARDIARNLERGARRNG
ncbi:phage tail tape measure protein [Thiohalobacter thiocyanaticus]|uniref:Phage tail tape measure protein n=1 Tax=Thiohalobacter thiocyanaticus TaxID=585455 RepID=A0A426QDX0_9GAMM|nr:phage tail tape measure protein [Thiohalobacter thiocyanaticus]RRQ19914.1 phage tail tape measure protein [Thiohalobacter thiocyanaticus]